MKNNTSEIYFTQKDIDDIANGIITNIIVDSIFESPKIINLEHNGVDRNFHSIIRRSISKSYSIPHFDHKIEITNNRNLLKISIYVDKLK